MVFCRLMDLMYFSESLLLRVVKGNICKGSKPILSQCHTYFWFLFDLEVGFVFFEVIPVDIPIAAFFSIFNFLGDDVVLIIKRVYSLKPLFRLFIVHLIPTLTHKFYNSSIFQNKLQKIITDLPRLRSLPLCPSFRCSTHPQ